MHSLRNLVLVCMFCASVAAHAADAAKGAQLYGMHCVSCHGRAGINVMPGAPNFARGEGLLQPDVAVMEALKRGRGGMPAYLGILRDQEMLDVIAYLRTLKQ